VNRKAGFLRQRLEGLVAAHPEVFESVRGSGLMLGLVCKATNTDVVAAGYDAGVLTVPRRQRGPHPARAHHLRGGDRRRHRPPRCRRHALERRTAAE
jgi:hypothetical protein